MTSPTATAIPEASATPSATGTPGSGAAECGNGFLEPGESFDDPAVGQVGDPAGVPCPADATVFACEPSEERIAVEVHFNAPMGATPNSVTVLLGYRSDLVSLPGSGLVLSVRQRITTPPPPPFVLSPNDLDYALRLVLSRTSPLGEGLLFSASFDRCTGAPAAAADQFGCFIEGCAGAGGPVADCTCSVVRPDG
jgi:hypothetical protein